MKRATNNHQPQNANSLRSPFCAESIFEDPVGYLAGFDIEAKLIKQGKIIGQPVPLPEAA